MATFSNIGLAEPSTITNKVAAVNIARGSTTEQQEILCLGDPDTSNAIAAVLNANPQSTAWGLVTRALPSTGFQRVQNSSAADFQATVTQASTAWAVQIPSSQGVVVRQSTAADLQATVAQASTVWAVQMPSSQVGGSAQLDSNNGSTTALVGDASFVGTGSDVSEFANVAISLYADEGSASSGMAFEFGSNSSNWDDVYRFTMSSGARRFVFPVTGQYFRVNYTNGSTAQSAFRVQTILHRGAPAPIVHRLMDEVGDDRSAILVKAGIIAQKAGSTNVFTPVTATAGGNLKVAVEEGVLSSLGGTVTLASTQNVIPTRGYTDLSTTTQVTSSNSTALYELISSAAASIHRVYAYAVTSTVATPGLVEFVSSAAHAKWGLLVGSGSSGVSGANLAMSPPGSIFKTETANALNFRAATSGVYQVSISYFTE